MGGLLNNIYIYIYKYVNNKMIGNYIVLNDDYGY